MVLIYGPNAVTTWFPPETKPVRKGMYQRDMSLFYKFWWSYWNGKSWGASSYFFSVAYARRKEQCVNQSAPWRGLISAAKSETLWR